MVAVVAAEVGYDMAPPLKTAYFRVDRFPYPFDKNIQKLLVTLYFVFSRLSFPVLEKPTFLYCVWHICKTLFVF